MKYLIAFFCVCLLTACVEVGNFSEKRIKLHEMGYGNDYCEKNPDRCVEGVPW